MNRSLARMRAQLRLPQLLAAAVVAALAGAMFAASSPARAELGDLVGASVSNFGYCIQNTNSADDPVYRVRISTNPLASFIRVSDPGTIQEEKDIFCPAEFAGRPVMVTPNGTLEPKIDVLLPELEIELSSSVVAAQGQDIRVFVRYKNAVQFTSAADAVVVSRDLADDALINPSTQTDINLQGSAQNVRLDYIFTAGGLPDPHQPLTEFQSQFIDSTANRWLTIPEGTAPGEYIISAQITYDEYTNDDRATPVDDLKTLRGSAVLTVIDDAVSTPATAALSLANTAEDNPLTFANEAMAGRDTAEAGGEIWLKLDSLDSLGNPADPAQLTSLTVLGQGATLDIHHAATGGGRADPAAASNINTVALTAAPGTPPVTVAPTMFVRVAKTDGMPGVVEVSALVVGTGGLVETDPITLTFTGPPATLALGDGVRLGRPAADAEAQAELALSAADAGGVGVSVPPSAVVYSITDADGNAVSGSAIRATTSSAGASTDSTRDDSNAQIALVTVEEAAEPGVYTITASLVGVADSSASSTITVTGPPASIALAADKTSSSAIGDVITVTATVADADGNPVADGLDVTFTASGASLVAIGTDASEAAGRQAKTAGGEAVAKFTVIGPGASVISGLIGGQSAVVVLTSTAGGASVAAETEAEPEGPRLTDFKRWTGLVSYQGPDTTASVLLRLLAGRASAIWLSTNDHRWLLYATVHGAPVPGAVDFDVSAGAVLYLSK